MLLRLRGGGVRVSSFLRFSAATKSTHPQFYSSFWSILNSSNSRQAKQTFTNFHGLEMKQYFCSRNATDDANMTIKTAKLDEAVTETSVDEQQQQQKKESDGGLSLAKRVLRSKGAGGAPKSLSVELCQGRSGVKFLQFNNKLVNGRFINFTKILVPGDAYPFVRAMDELLAELGTKEGAKLPVSSERGFLSVFSTSSPGKFYDFKMDLQWANYGRFVINLGSVRTEANPDHKERRAFFLGVKEFHWIRRTIGELLKEFDGSQPVDEPPKYPGWLMPDGRPRSSASAPRPGPAD